MNSNQTVLAMIIRDVAGEYIGGYENTLMDYPEGSKEYQEAKEFLATDHDTLVAWIVADVKRDREAMKHLKFAGNDFITQYTGKLLTKWGY